jgi:hypothetical protein
MCLQGGYYMEHCHLHTIADAGVPDGWHTNVALADGTGIFLPWSNFWDVTINYQLLIPLLAGRSSN